MAKHPFSVALATARTTAVGLVTTGLMAGAAWGDTNSDQSNDNDTGQGAEQITETTIEEGDALPEELPEVLKGLTERGVQIVNKLESPGELEAYAAIAQQQPLAVYLTPDKKHVIIGTMMDEEGMDVTSEALEEATVAPWTEQTWQALSDSTWVADGKDDAERIIYMFTDPNCPFCHKFWKQARPWVEAGKVQIRHILVAVLTDSSEGKAAALLDSDDPAQALLDHEQAGPQAGIEPIDDIPESLAEDISANTELMDALHIEGTPGIFYFDDSEQLQVQRGAPLDDQLTDILGEAP